MKTPCRILICLFLAIPVFAEEKDKRTISVSGKAEQSIPADKISISGEIRVVMEDLKEAQNRSKEDFEGMSESLIALGVKPEQVELNNHRIGKNMVREDDKELQKGFYSERSFLITLNDVKLLDIVSQTLAGVDHIEISGTSFSRTDEIEIRKKLRVDALKAAREKAIAMADVYGENVGRPLEIDENGGGFPRYTTRNTGHMIQGSSANGRVILSATVSVAFELTDPK